MRFFTADTHFSLADKSVIARDYRPFDSLVSMNKKIIKTWNKQVSKDDIIFHLGDFVNYNYKDDKYYERCFKYVQKIKAKVILLLGNNELRIMENIFNNNFEEFRKYLISLGFYDVIKDRISLKIGDKEYVLNHFPSKCNKNKNNLFAHIHNTVFVKRYGFNVGVDNHYFKLFSENEIIELEDRRKFFDENVYEWQYFYRCKCRQIRKLRGLPLIFLFF